MRPTRSLLVAFLAVLLWSTQTLAQPPEGGGGGRRRGGGGGDGQGQDGGGGRRRGGPPSDGQDGGGRRRGGPPDGKSGGGPSPDGESRGFGRRSWSGSSKGMDAGAIFDRMSGNKDVWKRSDAEANGQTSRFDRLASDMGVTNGEITRAQFVAYMEKKMAKQDAMAPTSSGSADDQYAKLAELTFRRLDRNGDGRLDDSEMPPDLRAELSKWDTNGNGTIELEEFKAYFSAKREQRKADFAEARAAYGGAMNPGAMPVMPGQGAPGKAEPKKPLVYTKNNLPKDLPPWFRDLADADAQIAFFEWRAAGRSLDEFRKYDLNNDGFITVDEVLAFQAQSKKSTATKAGFTVVQGGETIAGSPGGSLPGAAPPVRVERTSFPPGGTMPSQFDPNRMRNFRNRGNQTGGNQPQAPLPVVQPPVGSQGGGSQPQAPVPVILSPAPYQGGGTPTVIQGSGTPTK